MKVHFHPEASAELTEAHDWYAARNARAASEFIDEVLRATESIRDAPERWAIGRHGERRLPLRKFPFVVVYVHPSDDLVEVVAIAHQRRRPGYWRARQG